MVKGTWVIMLDAYWGGTTARKLRSKSQGALTCNYEFGQAVSLTQSAADTIHLIKRQKSGLHIVFQIIINPVAIKEQKLVYT